MKRFILYPLSAAMAVALGSVARAVETYEMSETQINDNHLAQSIDNNYDEGEFQQFEYRGPNVVGGILSPNDQGPNNRAIPTMGSSDFAEDRTYGESNYGANRHDPSYNHQMEMNNQMDEGDYPTENTIIAPDDQDPYNRANPTPNR